MSDQPDEQKLVLALSVSDEAPAHAALSKLSAMSEPERRRVLRPHWEDPDGITDEDDIALRRGFDLALNRLAALELGVSTGYLSLEAAAGSIEHPVRSLFKSRAVARFIDDYDYFQVRFQAAPPAGTPCPRGLAGAGRDRRRIPRTDSRPAERARRAAALRLPR
jgi:hypothetical protein